ncbi:oligodendrocyte-myelin glycoprotein [Anopheles bellator]|uniref:oligodendrocyte-myelin glycoprotein n=1 Tax=Anopheles bellator TaxID=139047 RepID=UPI002648D6C3|nr:oligodendrocyte-myelin glycoprotein [Anopheles bellator]XP_058067421.1 oligodendrocyte-myelin glycoprotein [Anopheles bellator]
MRQRLIRDWLVPALLLSVLLLSTSLVHSKDLGYDVLDDDGEDTYADEYDDTYDEDGGDGGTPAEGGLSAGNGDDSDKSIVPSTTTTTTTSSTGTAGPFAAVNFGDVDDNFMDRDQYACPSECSCSEGTKLLNCSHRALTDIPSGLPANMVRLDLSHNNLKRLNVEALQNCTALQALLLAGNAIEQFDKELLLKMDRLSLLDLSSNQLSHLDSDSFGEVSKSLRRLNLSDNPLVLPDSGPFLALPELEELYLVGCNLTELPDETFSELGGLSLLDLFGNQFDEDMSVDVFEPLSNLIKLRLPALSESTVRDLCDKVQRIDVIDITKHNISCFFLASETSFEDSIIVDVPITMPPVSTTREPTTARPTRVPKKNANDIRQEYKSSTSKLQASDLALHTSTAQPPPVRDRSNATAKSSGSPASASITDTGASPVDDGVVKTSATEANKAGDGQDQSLLSSISSETMKQSLMAIIGVTVLGLIIGLICRRTGIKGKLCGTKRRPAPTDQVRPAEEVPLNKV